MMAQPEPRLERSPLKLKLRIVPGIGLALCDEQGRVIQSQLEITVTNEPGAFGSAVITLGIDGDAVAWSPDPA